MALLLSSTSIDPHDSSVLPCKTYFQNGLGEPAHPSFMMTHPVPCAALSSNSQVAHLAPCVANPSLATPFLCLVAYYPRPNCNVQATLFTTPCSARYDFYHYPVAEREEHR
jgi:hypothetical protein